MKLLGGGARAHREKVGVGRGGGGAMRATEGRRDASLTPDGI